jgi:hypothetical protein
MEMEILQKIIYNFLIPIWYENHLFDNDRT